MASINLLIRIEAGLADTFAALSTNEGISNWFTRSECEDWSVGSRLSWFGETDMIITAFQDNEKISIHVNSGGGWENTDITFTLEQAAGKTIVRFDHDNWSEPGDLFRDCAMSWAYFLESLKLYLETGTGTPEGVAPPCESES